ncbi:hypothetical protein ACJVC5_07040 [Peredibacter sp. HCB2-198]|uniref:hypothetical protein n=1 Tax=Peredibacter sp. HCB2-198 TaxID=3383025 RepID=UPI0038B64A90
MTKAFLSLFLLLSLASCGGGGGGGSSSGSNGSATPVSANEISTDAAVPTAANNFEVNVELENFDADQEAKVLEAAELIKKVIATDEFKNGILNHSYNGKKGFVDAGGLSNAEIYQKILEGSEKLNPGNNNAMDLKLEVYHANNVVVGYTMPSVIKIWMNSKFLDKNNSAEVTTNMTHEWLHKLGFKHSANRTPTRKYSVPYAVGYLMRDLARKMI